MTFTALITFDLVSKQKTGHRRIFIEPKSKAKPFNGEKYDETLSKVLFNEVKVVCMVLTYPKHHNETDHYVERTWGKRCNKLIFISSEPVLNFETIVLNFNETREVLWKKVRAGFKYMYDHYINEYDWFLKADDDK